MEAEAEPRSCGLGSPQVAMDAACGGEVCAAPAGAEPHAAAAAAAAAVQADAAAAAPPPPGGNGSDVFDMDEAPALSPGPSRSPQPASTSGTATPPRGHAAGPGQNADIAVERRVVPLLEYSEDTCSICLDDYTREDPGAPTVCGHHFHLQCVMQWAQRSRECPLCFRSLQLEDEDMNSLLPFGEYVSPAQRAAEQATLETWELERLLLRLATAGQREHRHRSARQHASGGHRRQGSRGEASAPQPIRGGQPPSDAGGVRWSLPGEPAGGPSSSHGGGGSASAGRDVRPASAPGAAGSWPPPVGSEASSSGAVADEGHVVSPRSRSGSSLKSRLAALRLKDKFDKAGKELKSLFGSTGAGGGSGSAHQ